MSAGQFQPPSCRHCRVHIVSIFCSECRTEQTRLVSVGVFEKVKNGTGILPCKECETPFVYRMESDNDSIP